MVPSVEPSARLITGVPLTSRVVMASSSSRFVWYAGHLSERRIGATQAPSANGVIPSHEGSRLIIVDGPGTTRFLAAVRDDTWWRDADLRRAPQAYAEEGSNR